MAVSRLFAWWTLRTALLCCSRSPPGFTLDFRRQVLHCSTFNTDMACAKRKADEISEEDGAPWQAPVEISSDWTIEIVDSDNGSVASYRVHKDILSRRSEYFATVCHSNGFRESLETVSRVDSLSGVERKAFPIMLDYIYTGELAWTFENLVPLLKLAAFFRVESLESRLKEMRDKKMSLSSLPILYKNAKFLTEDDTLNAIVSHIDHDAKTLARSKEPDGILAVIDHELFMHVCHTSTSPYLISLINRYIRFHIEDINTDEFHEILESLEIDDFELSLSEAAMLLGLAKKCPNIARLPLESQTYLVEPIVRSRSKPFTEKEWTKIWNMISSLAQLESFDDKVLSTVHSALVQLFRSYPEQLEEVNEDKLVLLCGFLPAAEHAKITTILQKQCKSRKEVNEQQKAMYKGKIKDCMNEIQKFRRFNDPNIQKNVVSSFDRRTGETSINQIPNCLPKWGDQTEEGWVYKDEYEGNLALYKFSGGRRHDDSY